MVLASKMENAVYFVRGVVNSNQSIALDDVVLLLAHLFQVPSANLLCPDAGDINDDGSLNISDVIALLNYQFINNASAPVAPFPHCGNDPSNDNLPECITGC